MREISSIFFLVALTTVCFGQTATIFSDGDYTSSPAWQGTVSQFTVNTSGQLQLNATVAGTSYLSTSFSTSSLDDFEWQVYTKQGFAPSALNYGRIYLVSDQADLTQPLNGYYLQLGEALNNDAIELFRQNGSASVSVCRATNGAIANAFAVRIKVTRNNTGLWKLFVDYLGGTNFTVDASGTDATIHSSLYFGVRSTYTASNITKFYYNDFYAGPLQIDTTPPTVSQIKISSPNSLSVLFSEAVEKNSTETLSNYNANNSIGSPTSAELQPDGKTVLISFAVNFQDGVLSQLTVANVKDLAGNILVTVTLPFFYYQPVPPQPKDMIISEIFADPVPQVGLPAQEYIEIFNRSHVPFDLNNWKFSDGVSTAKFPSQVILPGQYWIVCASANVGLFNGYGHVIGVANFPTLNNEGDNLTLRDSQAHTIDSVNYTLDWYHQVDKQEGGWSLEIIDVNNICSGIDNWTASEDPSGGTPGRQNSVFASKPDLTGPLLVSVAAVSPGQVDLIFNEILEKDISQAVVNFTPAIPVQKIFFSNPLLTKISVQLNSNLSPRQLYTVRVSNLTDCSGNMIQPEFSQLSFALPEQADSLDVVINEVLFNPWSGGVDFVEVYNRSPKYLNLKNWMLANFESGTFEKPTSITKGDFILPPSGYLAFTSDPTVVSRQYANADQKFLFKTSVPSMPDNAGTIALVNNQGLVIDHFAYTAQMHSSLLKDKEGVSLERISFTEKTNDAGNWKSANASVGFATPGYLNSNTRPDLKINDNAVIIDPEIFSLSLPGQDFSKINYKFDQSGMAANVKILDAEGRTIKTMANNETLGYEGFLRWDGDRDDGTPARVGYYVVWFEVFDTSGMLKLFRKRVVIGK